MNGTRKSENYMHLIHSMLSPCTEVKFINFPTSAPGAFGNSWDYLSCVLNDLETPYNIKIPKNDE